MSKAENISYSFGPFSVDPNEQTLRRNGEPVPLAPKAFDTLLVLLENGGRLVSKEGLMRALWPDTFVEESNLTVHISALRRVFGEHNFVETVPKRGYRFQAGVVVRESTSVVIAEDEFDDEVGPDTLAVLPFKLLSAEGETEYLGLGMADASITRLSSIHRPVRPTSAVSGFTSLEQDPAEVCRKLRVKTVLEGSIRREQDRLRVRVQLIRADNFGAPLWAEQFDEQFTGILALEDAISERVATALMFTLTGEERKLLAKHQTENVEAYHHYLKGLYHANKWNIADSQKAIEHYQQAIALDRLYALAYAGLADSYCSLSHFYLAPSEAMQQARAAALRALEIDEGLAEGHHALALVEMWYDRNWTEVERRFKRAIALNEEYAPSHLWYGYFLAAMGRFDAGMLELQRAQEIDPLSLVTGAMIGWLLYFARRYDEAKEQFRKLIELEKNFQVAHWGLGWVHAMKGEYDQAISSFQTAMALSDGGTEIMGGLGYAYALAGQRDQAEKLLAELQKRSEERYVSPYYQALIHSGLAESDSTHKDKTIDLLEKAYEDRFEWLVHIGVDPAFELLLSEPRYKALLAQLGVG